MRYKLFKNGEFVNQIVASETFIEQYCNRMGYTYEVDNVEETRISSPNTTSILEAQIKAQGDRIDFLEDCIAEMAGIIYA